MYWRIKPRSYSAKHRELSAKMDIVTKDIQIIARILKRLYEDVKAKIEKVCLSAKYGHGLLWGKPFGRESPSLYPKCFHVTSSYNLCMPKSQASFSSFQVGQWNSSHNGGKESCNVSQMRSIHSVQFINFINFEN